MRRFKILSKGLFIKSLVVLITVVLVILFLYTTLSPQKVRGVATVSAEKINTESKLYTTDSTLLLLGKSYPLSVHENLNLQTADSSISSFSIEKIALKKTIVQEKEVKIESTPYSTSEPTATPTPKPTATPTPVPKELASNGEEYKYYEVYDKFYGSDEWHHLSKKLQKHTYELCIEYGIEKYYTLILAQLYYESQYDADVISKTNDYGIAQINKCNHKYLKEELGIDDFLDPYQGILANIYMMSGYLKQVGPEKALLWYNSGNPNTKIKRSWNYKSNIITLWKDYVREME